ncbi:MAG: site-2 protease family protein [Clostridia bacterium]|nr:site-2 protease family protein [Clostridia bacterium]
MFSLDTLASVWQKAWPIILAVLFFGFVIMSHELGHFSLARIFKVKINEFAIGMGPAIFKRKGKETQYSLRLFPIGGYVSMEGEDEESCDERAFCRKAPWQRFLIVCAGALINIFLGTILLSVLICQQDLVGTTQIHSFAEGSQLEASGLRAGDKIYKINGRMVFSDSDLSYLMFTDTDGSLEVTVKRAGEKVTISDVRFTTVEKDGTQQIVYDMTILGVEKNPWTVGSCAVRQTASVARMVWMSLGDLISGKYGLKDMSGPVGTVGVIADIAEESSKSMDYSALINLMAFISINIGVFNLLPIPALDGGRLLFIIIEMIFRKPVPAKYENWVHAAALVLLLGFMAIITFSDIFKLVKG